jgi:hypothetical protein
LALNKQVYYRLTALWALSEGVLGGIIHGFNLPISGLIVGSAAVIIICMIGFYAPEKSAIIKATILVCIFKLMLSPQSPFPAYIAVLFQGLSGSLFFWNKKFFKISCLLFAVIALIESAIQKVLVTTILFGMNFWKAVNDFINGLTHQKTITNYSLYFVSTYILLHLIVGIVIGRFAGNLPQRLKGLNKFSLSVNEAGTLPIQKSPSRRSKKIKTGLLIVWIILLLLFLQSQFHIGPPLLSSDLSLQIFIRSILIILAWYFVVSPVIMLFMKRWLEKQKEKSQGDIRAILELLPSTKMLLEKCWQLSSGSKGLKRLNEFCKMVLVNSLQGANE